MSEVGSQHTINRESINPVFLASEIYGKRYALVDRYGPFTYSHLKYYSTRLKHDILTIKNDSSQKTANLNGQKVAFLCENDISYLVSLFGIWRAGGVAVPLSKSHPQSELQYFIEDSQSSLVLSSDNYQNVLQPIAEKLNIPNKIVKENDFVGENFDVATIEAFQSTPDDLAYEDKVKKNEYKDEPAMIVYTSGTTGKPKGVLMTHGNLYSMMADMIEAWKWTPDDVILHVLPLHHVHGIVNALLTPLLCGATCIILPSFEPSKVWECLINGYKTQNGGKFDINLFMAVPTIYAKLIKYYECNLGRDDWYEAKDVKKACSDRIRLMVSGSAALPQPILEKWQDITGHTLLERYGMTETGMVLTNPLEGERIPGCVGNPFPGVRVCISKPNEHTDNKKDIIVEGDVHKTTVMKGMEEEQGELMVKSPSVFKEYWNRPEATREAFTADGWFKTGDTAIFSNGVYKIVGRTSVDIIKSGGYKISALDIERHLLAHPDIADCAVVGLPDETWGERVASVIVFTEGKQMTLEELRTWAKNVMPPYQMPSIMKSLDVMPRNAMGKVNKKEIIKTVFAEFLDR